MAEEIRGAKSGNYLEPNEDGGLDVKQSGSIVEEELNFNKLDAGESQEILFDPDIPSLIYDMRLELVLDDEASGNYDIEFVIYDGDNFSFDTSIFQLKNKDSSENLLQLRNGWSLNGEIGDKPGFARDDETISFDTIKYFQNIMYAHKDKPLTIVIENKSENAGMTKSDCTIIYREVGL